MLPLGIVRPDERGLITNPLGLAAVRLTNERFCGAQPTQKRCWTEPRGKHFRGGVGGAEDGARSGAPHARPDDAGQRANWARRSFTSARP